jgi:1-deoxyxylulose-5-phosphate synthase
VKRREFVKGAAIAAAFHNFPYHLYAGTKKEASDRVKIGPMKVELSRLAMGTGTNGGGGSSNQTKKLGIGGLADMYKAGYDMGITFWDTADQYGSHPHMKAALKLVPREKVTIMTKTHANTAAEMKADLDRFRREIGTDYLDIVLLHCMLDGDWNKKKRGAMDYLSEAREKGVIKTHGTSNHTMEALKTAAAEPWVQVNLARYNAAGIAMDAAPEVVKPVLLDMKSKGKGLICMKVLGAGRLRDKVDESLQFHLAQDFFDCCTIGAESRTELQDLTKKIAAASTRG